MNAFVSQIGESPLFANVAADKLEMILKCLGIKMKSYKKNETIISTGDRLDYVGGLLKGRIRCFKENTEGYIIVFADVYAPALFSDILPSAILESCPVKLSAIEDCEVFTINYEKLKLPCPSNCAVHKQIILNLMHSAAEKLVLLANRIEVLSQPSIRQKVSCFLEHYRGNEKKFAIPFNRNEMAVYLCVDRTRLSKELSKMRDEGLIWFHLNEFEIL